MKPVGWFSIVLVCLLSLVGCGSVEPTEEARDEPTGTVAQLLSGTITLNANSPTTSGYDFSMQVFTGATGGDFYLGTDGTFGTNNVGQRGIVSVGPCMTAD